MDHTNSTTTSTIRKRGQHLKLEDRCMIKALHQLGYSLRRIAREVNCSPSTVMYELKRGTLEKASTKGRSSVYSPSRGQKKYEENRQRSMKRTGRTVIGNTSLMLITHLYGGCMSVLRQTNDPLMLAWGTPNDLVFSRISRWYVPSHFIMQSGEMIQV